MLAQESLERWWWWRSPISCRAAGAPNSPKRWWPLLLFPPSIKLPNLQATSGSTSSVRFSPPLSLYFFYSNKTRKIGFLWFVKDWIFMGCVFVCLIAGWYSWMAGSLWCSSADRWQLFYCQQNPHKCRVSISSSSSLSSFDEWPLYMKWKKGVLRFLLVLNHLGVFGFAPPNLLQDCKAVEL